MIREIYSADMMKLREIHEKYYAHEFEFPEFHKHFLSYFASVDDESGKLITAGGVRLITEAVLITDKDASVKSRRKALYEMLAGCNFVTSRNDYDQLHCFIQDEDWLNQLIKVGFSRCRGTALYVNV